TLAFLAEARKLDKPILLGVMSLKSVKMARFMNEYVAGIDVPDEVIARMENEGATGIEITCDFIEKVIDHIDGIHIMAMGDVQGTNSIIEFVHTLVGK
ncbi:MAG: 5,10-methylenetetrahydrofolate reductase, partial [Candidatus Electrothrix sp. AR5]|nr:5,10-methylenetetrahydrofolate reductase [Candidatus Electrothrix sp. AR5]